jgi:hypothetical protein
VSIHAVGIVKCDRCQSSSVVVGAAVEGTHGNSKIKWTLPSGWSGSPAGSPPGHLCFACVNPLYNNVTPPRKPMDVNVLANIISVLRAEAKPEDMVEALRALLAVET